MIVQAFTIQKSIQLRKIFLISRLKIHPKEAFTLHIVDRRHIENDWDPIRIQETDGLFQIHDPFRFLLDAEQIVHLHIQLLARIVLRFLKRSKRFHLEAAKPFFGKLCIRRELCPRLLCGIQQAAN